MFVDTGLRGPSATAWSDGIAGLDGYVLTWPLRAARAQ
jgi:hypothetical protein